ncbi:MAG: MBL fold metallo-hydrolase [Alphaproteobacteria bacterium]
MKRCALKVLSCGSCRHPEIMTRKDASFKIADFPSYVGLIEHPDEGVILFDTGYDPAFLQATQSFPERLYRWTTPVHLNKGESAIEQLQKNGYSEDDVRAIIISHFHGDHVAGIHHFKNAKLFCSKAGHKYVRELSRFKQVRRGILSSLLPDDIESRSSHFEDCKSVSLPAEFSPFVDAVDLLGDGSLLAVELPGHCPGHWGLALRTEQDRFVFLIADAAWSITAVENNTPPPKITMALLGSSAQFYQTLNSLHGLSEAGRDLDILPSHCKKAVTRYQGGGL